MEENREKSGRDSQRVKLSLGDVSWEEVQGHMGL